MVNWALGKIIALIGSVLPALGLDPQFLAKIDELLSVIISLIQTAAWFVPLDILVLCFSTIMVVDHWGILMRVGKWVIQVLPFT